MSNIQIEIESALKFAITIWNAYSEKLVAVPGSTKRTKQQDPADVDRFTFKVNRFPVNIGDKFRDFIYKGVIREIPNKIFIEDPCDLGTKDPIKALNTHFKNFHYGDTVPVEYMIWRFTYSYKQKIMEDSISFNVTDSNYPAVQWLFQALYNDMQTKFNRLPKGFLQALHKNLKGRKELVAIPTKVIDSTVGVYNALVANKDSFEADLKQLEVQLAAKRKILDSIGATVNPVEDEPVNIVSPGATEFVAPRRGRPKKEEAIADGDS